jgi:hypothetical protein
MLCCSLIERLQLLQQLDSVWYLDSMNCTGSRYAVRSSYQIIY